MSSITEHIQKNIIIISASGHERVVAEIIRRSGDRIIGFLDDTIQEDLLSVKFGFTLA